MNKKAFTMDDEQARRLYRIAPAELREVFESNYSKEFFAEDITERIKSFEDACEYNNTNPKAFRFINGTRNQIYQERVAEIVKALNEGWEPNYDDSSEYKFAPWFYLNKPGFRFDASFFALTYTATPGGSRFALKNRKLSDYAGIHFVKEYEMWLMPVRENANVQSAGGCSISPKPFTGSIKEWEDYIIPLVGSFEDACRHSGVDPDAERFQTGTPDEIAYKKGKVVCDVLNGPFMHLMKDLVSPKYYAWMEKTVSGFRFFASRCDFSCTFATGGSRLRLCSEKLSKHFATSCCDMMAPYWWNE